MDARLSADQVRRIRLAKSAAEIAEICAETEVEQAERLAQSEAEHPDPNKILKPRYWSDSDGFMHEYRD